MNAVAMEKRRQQCRHALMAIAGISCKIENYQTNPFFTTWFHSFAFMENPGKSNQIKPIQSESKRIKV
jgi:hypothetical protein